MYRTLSLPTSVWTSESKKQQEYLSRIGKHWSAEKIANTFAPSKKTQDGVVDWLVKSGIDVGRHKYSTGT